MNFEDFVSLRYLTSSKGHFLAFLNIVSIGGVAIGVMALIVVLGVMTGFGNNLRDKIIGTTPHLMVEKEVGVQDFEAVTGVLSGIPEVKAFSPYVQGNVFLETGSGRALSQIVRGVVPGTEVGVTKIQEYLQEGSLRDLAGNGVIIGSELARFSGYRLGDVITLIVPGSGLEGRGWRYQLVIVGIFNSGMVDLDMNLLLVDLAQAQEIFNLPADTVTGIGVTLANPYRAQEAKVKIHQEVGYAFLVRSWIDMNRNLFEALFLEKWGLFIILAFMVLVAAFNIISTLVVMVTSKIYDIGIMQSFGVTRGMIRRIFTKQGVLIGTQGTALGVALGVGISYLLKHYVKVPVEIYSITHVPVDLQLSDMLIIITASMLITFLAALYPAARAASFETVDALRYE